MRDSRLALLLSTVAAACGSYDLGAAQQPIIGGTPDQGDTSVVMVYGSNPSQPGYFICTGSVISPHVVLTAAHCVAPSEVGVDAQFQIFTGNDFNDRTQQNDPTNYVAVKEVHANPLFKGMHLGQGNDVGVIITAAAMTQTPLPVNHSPITEAQRRQPVHLTGYGLLYGNDTSGRTAGTKRQADTVLGDYDEAFLYFFDPNHNTCHGDSGGPQLMMINGYVQIIGVTSYDTVIAGQQPCSDHSTDTRIDAYTGFIDPFIDKFDPTWQHPDLSFTPPPDMALPPPDQAIAFTRTGGCTVGDRAAPVASLALVGLALTTLALRRRRRA